MPDCSLRRRSFTRAVVALTAIASGVGSTATPAAEPVRVMSYNIRYGTAADGENAWPARRELLVETIRQFDPDLLGTQETLRFQRDELLERLPHFKAAGVGRDDGHDRGEMAAIFWRTDRFARLDGGDFWLSPTPDRIGSKGWDAALPRIATWVKLADTTDSASLPVLFVNTHFDHRGTEARRESAALLRRWIADRGRGCRVILTGDFNAGEGSPPYHALFAADDTDRAAETTGPAGLVDTLRAVVTTRGAAGPEGTFTGFVAADTGGERIDWIACSRSLRVVAAGIDRTARDGRTPSDHAAVTAVLE